VCALVQEKQTCFEKLKKISHPVAVGWGGPAMAVTDDNPWSYWERFAGGTTTAHGINRVFDDDNGPVRRLFWLIAFCCGCYGSFSFFLVA
jgi:hypothetical protein